MEGAAVAQVCLEHGGVPLCVIRSISDLASGTASIDFPLFLDTLARHYSAEILSRVRCYIRGQTHGVTLEFRALRMFGLKTAPSYTGSPVRQESAAWPCQHLTSITVTEPTNSTGCEDCIPIGARWLHLRMCMSCGHVGCCNDSPNRHAAAHFDSTGTSRDPVVRAR